MTPATEAELRWTYRMSRLEAEGISFDQALAAPALRAALELGAAMRRKRRERAEASAAGAGIERSHPDYSSTQRSTP